MVIFHSYVSFHIILQSPVTAMDHSPAAKRHLCWADWTSLPICIRGPEDLTVMAMAISYNWLFQWDNKQSINGIIQSITYYTVVMP